MPFSAKISLIDRFLVDWDKYCDKCFSSVHELTLKVLREVVKAHFGNFNTPLPTHVAAIVEELVQRCYDATRERIQWMLGLEHPPFTVNDHYFASYRDKYLAKYREARRVRPCAFSDI